MVFKNKNSQIVIKLRDFLCRTTLPSQALKCWFSSPSFLTLPLSSSSLLFASGISVWVCLLNAAVAGGYQDCIPTLPASQCRDKAMLWQRKPLSRSQKDGAQGLHNRGQWHTHTHLHKRIHTSPLRNHFSVLAVPSLCKYNLAFNASA